MARPTRFGSSFMEYAMLIKAKTIGELKAVLETMIAIHGSDAKWWGWDDGSIVIQGVKDDDIIDSCCYGGDDG